MAAILREFWNISTIVYSLLDQPPKSHLWLWTHVIILNLVFHEGCERYLLEISIYTHIWYIPSNIETHHLQNVKRSMIIDWTSWKIIVLMFLTIAINCNVSLSLNLETNKITSNWSMWTSWKHFLVANSFYIQKIFCYIQKIIIMHSFTMSSVKFRNSKYCRFQRLI